MLKYLQRIVDSTFLSAQFDYKTVLYTNGEKFLENAAKESYDIILLDIEMKGISGLEVSKKLQQNRDKSVIVFVTSYEGYIKDAFGLNVYDYILKQECQDKLPDILREIVGQHVFKEKISLKTEFGLKMFNIEDILYLSYNDRFIFLHTEEEETVIRLVYASLLKVKQELPEIYFFQPNNRYIVNMAAIDTFHKGILRIKGTDFDIEISRGKYKEFKDNYLNYLIEGNFL